MRIVVVDFAANTGGATSILKSFYQYLIDSHDANEWFFLLSNNYIPQTENIKVVLLTKEKQSRIRRLAFDFVYGRKFVNQLQPDAVFYLQNTLIHGVHSRQVVYMDQPIPFQDECNFSFMKSEQRTYAIYQYIIGTLIKSACKKADDIIVQTDWMKESICNKCAVPSSKVLKIQPAKILEIELLGIKKSIDNPVFFYPANFMYYKNHRCIDEAVKILVERDITDFSVEYTLSGKASDNRKIISYIGTIPQEEVVNKFMNNILVFPSYVESYGLPLAEAKSVGAMILASNTAFSREILEGYPNAYFFDPFSPVELATLMERVIRGELKKEVLQVNDSTNKNPWASVVELLR